MTPKYIEERCPQCDRSVRTVINGEWLREARHAAGLTLDDMAKRLGFGKMYLSEIERNEKRATPKILDAYEALIEVVR